MNIIRNTIAFSTIGLLLASCGHTDAAKFDGTVKLSARLEGEARPTVVGVTNLPDGTSLMVSLYREQSSYSAQSKTTVSGGTFQAGPFSQQGSDLNPGKYNIRISSPLTSLQPASVQAVFGDKGSNLKGPLTSASSFGDDTVISYSTQVELGGNADTGLDAAARDKAKKNLDQWLLDSCDDNCRTLKGVAVTQGKPFDQDACYQRCTAEIPAQ